MSLWFACYQKTPGCDVRFGSKGDMSAGSADVRSAPISGLNSDIARSLLSAPIADITHKVPRPIREAAFSSLKVLLPPVRAPVDPPDASEELEAFGF